MRAPFKRSFGLAEIFFGPFANLFRERRALRAPGRRLAFESLEHRILLSADLAPAEAIDPAGFTFDAPINRAADSFTLRFNADTADLELLKGTSVVLSRSLAATSAVVINGEDGQDDSLTIDFAFGGFFSVAGGITYNGGEDGFDALSVTGGEFTTVTHTVTTTAPGLSGNIVYEDGVNPASVVNYTGLEPVDMTGSIIANLVFNLPGTADQAILEDDGVAANGVSRIRSQNAAPTFDVTTFANPNLSLTVNMGGDNGTITLASLPDFNRSLTINGQAGMDNVTFMGTTAFEALSVAVGGSITVNSTLRTTGTAGAGMILLQGGSGTVILNADIVTAGAAITINDSVILGNVLNVTLDTTNGGAVAAGANITITGTVDDDTSATSTVLIAMAGTAGDVNLQGALGGTVAILGLAVLSADDVSLPSISTVQGGVGILATNATDPSITLNGNIDTTRGLDAGNLLFVGPVTLGANVAIMTDHVTGLDGSLFFFGPASAVNADVAGFARTLSIDAGNGDVSFDGAVGGTAALGQLTARANAIAISGGAMATTGDQTYTGAVTLGADTTLAGNDISFAGRVDSDATARALAINTAGNGTTTFGAAAGGNSALASLTTNADGATVIAGGGITTTGSQTYNDAVIIGTNTVSLIAPGGVFITSSATLHVDLSGTAPGEFGRVDISGQVSLGGTLDVERVNDFLPTGGDRFQFMTFASRTGFFGNLPADFIVIDTTAPVGLELVFAQNDAPVFVEIGPQSVQEGRELRFTVTATDVDDPADTLTFTAGALPAGARFDAATREFVWLPLDDARATVTFTVTDGHASDTMDVLLTATNVAPTVDAGRDLVVGLQDVDDDRDDDDDGDDRDGDRKRKHGKDKDRPEAEVSIAATFDDLGLRDTHTATINWGDGTVTDGRVVEPTAAADGAVKGRHTYTKAGRYTVIVTVTDDDGGVHSDTLLVTVKKPIERKNFDSRQDDYRLDEDSVLRVNAAKGVLANDRGPAGATLLAHVVEGPRHGTLAFNADGSFTYTPDRDFHGKDSFWYEFTDDNNVSRAVEVELKVKDVRDGHRPRPAIDWDGGWQGGWGDDFLPFGK